MVESKSDRHDDRDSTLLRNLSPRNLRAPDAAAYIGVSQSKFRELVKDGRMPPPFYIDGCAVWDRFDIDTANDRLKAEPHVANFFDAKIEAMKIGK
jgi:predicted DNA-binding transcriptional regulator AlpA